MTQERVVGFSRAAARRDRDVLPCRDASAGPASRADLDVVPARRRVRRADQPAGRRSGARERRRDASVSTTWPMRADLRGVASALALGAALASIGYAAFAIARVRAFGRRANEQADAASQRARHGEPPAVTILKPRARRRTGARGEPALVLRRRTIPTFDVVFGVLDPDDAALDVPRAASRPSFPNRTTRRVPATARAHSATRRSPRWRR